MPRVEAKTVAEHRRLILDRLFSTFETLIYERGYDALTLADIAKAARLARTAMYNYFPDKESLLLAYTAHEMDDFFSDLRVRLAHVDDPLDKLDAYVDAQVTYFATHHLPPGPALRSVLSGEAYRVMQDHAAVLEATLKAILDEASGDRLVPSEVAENAATVRLVLSCLGSGQVRDLRGKRLEATIAETQAFVRRAVGATSA